MSKYPGRVLSATPPTVSANSASGVWTQEEVAKYNAEGVWPLAPLPNDPYFQNVTLLLHGDGNQGATNFSNTSDPVYLAFKDNSSNNFPITVNGDAYGDNFGPFALEDGYWSNYFDGTNSYLTSASDASAFVLGSSGDFTIECWVYPSGSQGSYAGVLMSYASWSQFSGRFALAINGTTLAWLGSTGNINISTTITTDAFSHVAVVRSGSTITMYLNGTSVGTTTSNQAFTTTPSAITLGLANAYFKGYISNARVVKGTAVYTGAFTPSTTPLTAIANTSLLTCQSNRFVDNSTNNFTITPAGNVATKVFNPFGTLPDGVNGSGYFDGTGDYISVPDNAAFALGSNDWTLECWVYITGGNNAQVYIGQYAANGADSTIGFLLGTNASQYPYVASYINGSYQQALSSTVLPLNQWNHVAGTRSGSTLGIFLNGNRLTTTTVSGSAVDSTAIVTVGAGQSGSGGLVTGYVSSARLVNGTALYAGTTYTIPTAPLTNVTNTSLLTCQYAGTVRNVGFIDSGPYDFPITRVGNTTQGSLSPFSKQDGAWSNCFNGSSDILVLNNVLAFGSNDFTWECWVYLIDLSSANVIVDYRPVTTNGNYFTINVQADGTFRLYVNGAIRIDSTAKVQSNTWTHLCIERSSGTTTMYIDGVADSTTWSDSTNYITAANRPLIGRSGFSNASYLEGWVSNMRAVLGSAVYGGDFTPSTSPLTTTSQGVTASEVELLTCQSNRFIDNSSNGYAISLTGTPKVSPFSPFPITTEYSPSVNGGSAYFDGSGDYLVTASNVNALGTGDFTFETWVYPTSISNFKYLFSINGDNNFSLVLNNNSYTPYFYVGAVIILSSKDLIGNQWNHVALVRNGGGSNNLTMYVNGESGGSATFTANITAGPATISARAAGTPYFLQGYQSGLRVTSNAIYTSAFTPPSTPPTAISGTELLLNFTNAGIYDSTGFNNLETVGNAQVDTNTVKFGTGSMKFDGSGDYCVGPNQPWMNFGSGNLTIECWVRFNSVSSTQMFVSSNYNASTGGGGWTFGYRADNTTLIFSVNANVQYGKTWTPSIDTWYFVTVCRDGTSLRFFVDGTQIGTTSTSSDNISGATTLMVGSNLTTPQYLNGYIDDLRITKGVARYTANFTPPTIAFRNIGA